jgi:hypothetical protein
MPWEIRHIDDVTFLFIANKPLDIHYTQAGQPGSPG